MQRTEMADHFFGKCIVKEKQTCRFSHSRAINSWRKIGKLIMYGMKFEKKEEYFYNFQLIQ